MIMSIGVTSKVQRIRDDWTEKKSAGLAVAVEAGAYFGVWLALITLISMPSLILSFIIVIIGVLLQLRQEWRAEQSDSAQAAPEDVHDADLYRVAVTTRARLFGLGGFAAVSYIFTGTVVERAASSVVQEVLFRE